MTLDSMKLDSDRIYKHAVVRAANQGRGKLADYDRRHVAVVQVYRRIGLARNVTFTSASPMLRRRQTGTND